MTRTSFTDACLIISVKPYTYHIQQSFRGGKTFTVVSKIHNSLENFHSALGCGHHVLYAESDSRGKLSRLAEKL